eukprot:COSAG03_NODE_6192_length_1099_cov_1.305000_1_plen_203_part_00
MYSAVERPSLLVNLRRRNLRRTHVQSYHLSPAPSSKHFPDTWHGTLCQVSDVARGRPAKEWRAAHDTQLTPTAAPTFHMCVSVCLSLCLSLSASLCGRERRGQLEQAPPLLHLGAQAMRRVLQPSGHFTLARAPELLVKQLSRQIEAPSHALRHLRKDFSDLCERMSGKGGSASEAHLVIQHAVVEPAVLCRTRTFQSCMRK